MPYDEGLAKGLREALQSRRGISEKKMFGGITGDVLMARIGPEYYQKALSRPNVRVPGIFLPLRRPAVHCDVRHHRRPLCNV